MKKLLVGVTLYEAKLKVEGITLCMPDNYSALHDSPDSEEPYPTLRGSIYEEMKKRHKGDFNEFNKYWPSKIGIIGISELGYVQDEDNKVCDSGKALSEFSKDFTQGRN